jgi:hypothetical protein
MSDTNQPPISLPPLPEEYSIPLQLIESWLQIPEHKYVSPNLTRADLDSLFNCIDKSLKAQANFQNAMVAWTSGNIEESNRLNHDARRLMLESSSAIRRFFAAIMASATKAK